MSAAPKEMPDRRLMNVAIAIVSEPEKRGMLKTPLAAQAKALDFLIERAMRIRAEILGEMREKNSEGSGHFLHADKAYKSSPGSSLSNGDEKGQTPNAEKANRTVPDSSPPNRSGEGLRCHAGDGQNVLARPAAGHSIGANAAAEVTMLSVLTSHKMPDGRYTRRIKLRELPHYFNAGRVSSNLARALYQNHANQDQSKCVGDVETNESFATLKQAAEKECTDAWHLSLI